VTLPSDNLRAVFALAVDDVWVVGDAGTALHFDGAVWSIVPTGVSHALYGLWASGPDAIWAVGGQGDPASAQGVILFSDGGPGGFTIVDDAVPGTLRSISGTSANDIWAAGHRVRLHNDGSGFVVDSDAPDFAVAGIWAAAPDVAWVVGENGRSQRYDGSGWQDVATGLGPVGLSAVGGVGRDDALALATARCCRTNRARGATSAATRTSRCCRCGSTT
jgi:hypothetical protein